ncbi:MAG: hypothetical protein K2Y37_18175 [Pirellulales bacterium]|nr:hypothetical protein [Pirellulales bacterium]
MQILRFLTDTDATVIDVEYRLLCSGTLYPANVQGDWRKSDGARILLREPFNLIVASQPYDDYPQELALRFTTKVVSEQHESGGKVTSLRSFVPDDEIAADLAALLSLLGRRLVTVAGKVRQRFSDGQLPPELSDFPSPLAMRLKKIFWPPRLAEVVHHRDGVDFKDNQPAPTPFDWRIVAGILKAIPSHPAAEAIIRSARQYALALELIEDRFELAYQQLISAIETVAGPALSDWTPEPESMIESKQWLIAASRSKGLSIEDAQQLAIEACARERWASRKFLTFVLKHINAEVLNGDDDLFLVPEFARPKGTGIEKTLRQIYEMRSGASHGGKSYPASASIGPSPTIPSSVIHEVLEGKAPFPPIGWFERLVNSAIVGYIKSTMPV